MNAFGRILSALAAALILLSLTCAALAVTPEDYDASKPDQLENDHLYAETAFLFDMDTRAVLVNKNSRVRMYPASTTKIMTLLLALESGIPMEQEVIIPKEAGNVPEGSSVIGIKPNDRMTWGDLLYSFMLKSGNDGSNAIAVLTSGSIPAFVERMNERAVEMGCEGTHFTNAHGYHDQDHYTTAQDLARMSLYAMQNADFRAIVAAPSYEITITRGEKTASGDAVNRNSLVDPSSEYYYPGANGIKTGHHSQAGWCVVASAERDGVRLMAVVLKCSTEARKWSDARRLFDYGFSQYRACTMAELLGGMQAQICSVTFENAAEDDVSGGRMMLKYGQITGGDATRMIQINSSEAMQRARDDVQANLSIEWNRALVAPVTAGEVLGVARFAAPDGTEVAAELVASRDIAARLEPTPAPTPEPVAEVEKATTADNRRGGLNRGMIAVMAAAVAVVTLIVVFLALKRRERRRREAARRRRRAARRNGRT